jgi:hypothetical protein
MIAECEQRGLEEQARVDFQYPRAKVAIKELAKCHKELSLVLVSQLDAIPKKMSAGIGIIQHFTLLELAVPSWRYGKVCLGPSFLL